MKYIRIKGNRSFWHSGLRCLFDSRTGELVNWFRRFRLPSREHPDKGTTAPMLCWSSLVLRTIMILTKHVTKYLRDWYYNLSIGTSIEPRNKLWFHHDTLHTLRHTSRSATFFRVTDTTRMTCRNKGQQYQDLEEWSAASATTPRSLY